MILDTGQEDGRMTVDLARLEASLVDAEAAPPPVETTDIPIVVEKPVETTSEEA